MLKVSIIIPTFNRCKSVRRLLEALNDQTFPPGDFEVMVLIDGSQDGTKEMVENFIASYKLRYIWEPNSGRASACNRGIHEAKGDVLIILDDDMEPCTGFVQAHYAQYTSSRKLAVLGSAPVTITDSSSPVVRYIGNKFNTHLKKTAQPGYNIRIWDFYGGNFSISRELLLDLGLYNETFTTYGHEDVELAYRFINNGVTILFSNEALCTQHYEKSFRSLANNRIAEGKTAVQLVDLYPETFTELKLREYNSAGWEWRALRLSLIHISLLFSPIQDLIVMTIKTIEKLVPSRMKYLYDLTLDYFFWLGVWTAIKSDSRNEKLKSQIKFYKTP